jgi:predicted amidophosphoribosyltransferase
VNGFIPLLIIVVIVWAILSSTKGRRGQMRDEPRACIQCGTVHPPYANYCRHCGKPLA